jgi:hypothetical protein
MVGGIARARREERKEKKELGWWWMSNNIRVNWIHAIIIVRFY